MGTYQICLYGNGSANYSYYWLDHYRVIIPPVGCSLGPVDAIRVVGADIIPRLGTTTLARPFVYIYRIYMTIVDDCCQIRLEGLDLDFNVCEEEIVFDMIQPMPEWIPGEGENP